MGKEQRNTSTVCCGSPSNGYRITQDQHGGFLNWGYPQIIHFHRVFHPFEGIPIYGNRPSPLSGYNRSRRGAVSGAPLPAQLRRGNPEKRGKKKAAAFAESWRITHQSHIKWGTQARWMVDFMENPKLKWMRTGGTPMTQETFISSLYQFGGYHQASSL